MILLDIAKKILDALSMDNNADPVENPLPQPCKHYSFDEITRYAVECNAWAIKQDRNSNISEKDDIEKVYYTPNNIKKDYGISFFQADRVANHLIEEHYITHNYEPLCQDIGIKTEIESFLKLPIKSEKQSLNIDKMSGYEFEWFCAKLLRKIGYYNVLVTQSSSDQGIDVLAEKDGIRFAIQCKHYSGTVGNKAVQEAYAGCRYYDCDVPIVMTNSYFSDSAKQLANKNQVILWDRNILFYYIERWEQK